MLNNNLKVEKKEATNYEPLPENIYQVQLLDINAKEAETYNSKMGKTEQKQFETIMSFQFTLLKGKNGTEDLRGRNVWENFVPTVLYIGKNGKNKLYQIVEALLGRELDLQEEAEGIDGNFLNSLIGKQCRIGTKHKKVGDKIYDNIDTYYSAEDELTPLTEEEKDKASVKKKEKEDVEVVADEEINPNDIPY